MAELPPWQPLAAVQPPASGSGRVVGLVASEAAASAWGPDAAIGLARAWSRLGRRVVLVDGAVERPTLHEAVGMKNREGLTDAALHGVSIARAARPVDGGAFFLITSGGPVAEAGPIVRGDRWHRLTQGITEAGADMLLYLHAGERGAAAFLGSASDIVVLATPEEPVPSVVRDLTPLVRAVTGSDDAATAALAALDAAAIETPPPADAGPDAGASPTRPASASSKTAARAPSSSSPSLAPKVRDGEGGVRKVVLLLIGALAAAAGLGYLLTSLL